MGTLVQIRDVPEPVHRTLEARAAAAGMTLSYYLRVILEQAALRPTPEELAARIRIRGRVELPEPSDRIVRRLRDRGE
jgi:plasmid stability protein